MSLASPTLLADESWSPCSKHAVILAFLRAEWDKSPQLKGRDRHLITTADITDTRQNNQRMTALWSIRGALLKRLPGDTQWFEVKYLREGHFWQLHAINFLDWNSPEDMNELEKVAVRRRQPLLTPVASWEPSILWGHERSGSFTIIEGNHRLSALAGTLVERRSCAIPVYVGLSPSLCHWHLPDVAGDQTAQS
ncbi:MAG: hypothetical protein JWM63_2068 [Gammaproteobacteria bacterium]|jgi:hypothetical protein|nr:hypothetical protein [Gammaproteobacteria bacterium]